jgi:hypothetical protein
MRAVALLLSAVVAQGCATATTSHHVEATLEGALPGCRFERDEAVVLGRTSLALLRWLSGAAGDELDADTRDTLRGVRRVEVTSYHATHGCEVVGAAPLVSRRLAGDGWHAVIAAADDDGELSWVFTREGPDGSTNGLLVITLGDQELEVARIDGDIDRVLIAALAEDPSPAKELASIVFAADAPAAPRSGTR